MAAYLKKILNLFKSPDQRNIELAFQLCIGLEDEYGVEIRTELHKHIFLFLKYGLETDYCESLKELKVYDQHKKKLATGFPIVR